MIEECQEIDRFVRQLELGKVQPEDPAWRVHRQGCESCSVQWQAERELRSHFAEVPRPGLSPAFESSLRQRLVAETVGRSAFRLERLLLPAYWSFAVVASFVILGRFEWPAQPTLWAWALTGGLVWLAFAPIAALARRVGLDALDLVFLPAD